MYASFFGLTQSPFSIAPDPRYLFMSERHREALAHLLYGLDAGGGFVLLTGEVGTGKTTVCRCFLEQVPAHCNVAYIFNPRLTTLELLHAICDEFGVSLQDAGQGQTVKDCVDPLNAFLLGQHAQGRNNILIIDEAQNLAPDVLEQLRLLTNLETSERKLLQIILIGQPELRSILATPALEPLAQRVIARYHLQALDAQETQHYLAHRMAVAGWQGPLPMDARVCRRIHQLSGGIPRRINVLCERVLLGAYAAQVRHVTLSMVAQAGRELQGAADAASAGRQPWRWLVLGWLAGGLMMGGAAFLWHTSRGANPTVDAAKPTAKTKPNTHPAADARKVDVALPPSQPEPPQLPTPLSAWFADPKQSSTQAWQGLAAQWQLSLPTDAAPDPQEGEALATWCAHWAEQGVRCAHYRRADAALLQQINRPVILTLQVAQGPAAQVLLLGWDATGKQVTLHQPEGAPVVLAWASLVAMWRGQASTLWRMPASLPKPRELLQDPAGQTWLQQQLDQAKVAPDPILRTRIQAFQQHSGLQADGVPGPLTLMQLNHVTGVDEPQLQLPAPSNTPE